MSKGGFESLKPRNIRSDFRVKADGSTVLDEPVNKKRDKIEEIEDLIAATQVAGDLKNFNEAIVSASSGSVSSGTYGETTLLKTGLNNNSLNTGKLQKLREELLKEKMGETPLASDPVSSDEVQEIFVSETFEDEDFEILPFSESYGAAFAKFLATLDVNSIDNENACPLFLLDSLKKTGVTISSTDDIEHTITISQKLKSGHFKELVLTPREVLEFLKDAVDFSQETYADLEHKKSTVSKNTPANEEDQRRNVDTDKSVMESSSSIDDVSIYDFSQAHVSIEDRSRVKGLKSKERYLKGDSVSWPKELLLILERFGATNIERLKDEENNISFDLVTTKGEVIHHKKKQSELIDFLFEAEKLLGQEKPTQKKPYISAVLGAMRKTNASEEGGEEGQNGFEDSHLDPADDQDSVVVPDAKASHVSGNPVLNTLSSLDLNLDEAITPMQRKETFDSRFTFEFDIGEEEMNSIEGFQSLSVPQQKILFENLSEYAERGDKTWLDKGWSGIKASFGIKGEGIPSQGSRGMKAYGEILKKLVYATDKFGPKVHEDETTKELRVDFIGLIPDRAHRQEQKEVEDALNGAAHAFACVPESWQEDGNGVHAKNESKVTTFFKEKFMGGLSESRKRYREFEEKQTAFDVAKREFAKKLEETGVPLAEIVRALIDVEAKVHNLRFIDTNPEAVDALKNISEAGFWEKAGRTAMGASGYFALGMGSRAIISGALGMLSGPAVAMGIGSLRSWNKFNAEQRDRDSRARMGDADTSAGALNIVSAGKDMQITDKDGGVEKKEVGITAKLENLVTKFKNLSDTATQEEKEKLIDTLNARAIYSLDKFKLNRIQFGNKEEFAVNQAKFFEVLGMATVILANNEKEVSSEDKKPSLEKRLERYMEYREGAIDARRTKARIKNVAWAATKAGAFSLAGAFAMEEIKTGSVSETVRHWFNRGAEVNTFNTASSPNIERVSSGMVEVPTFAGSSIPDNSSIHSNESVLPNEEIITKLSSYHIRSGDTLTKIVKENIPAIKGITNPMEKERILANLFKSLTPHELSAIGIRSGDVNTIYSGDSIKLDKLDEILKSKHLISAD